LLTKNEKTLTLFSLLLFITGVTSINIYLPSLLNLVQVFHTDTNSVKLSISLFLFSYAISQFFWGSLSEKTGRKKAILIGLSIASVGTLLALLAPNIFLFNTARFIEGFGIGCSSVLARALLVDTMDRAKLTIAISYTATAMNITPALAPIIGGHLQYWFGWRYIFLFLLIYTLTLLILLSRKLQDIKFSIKKNINIKTLLIQYKEALKHREFIGYSLPFIMLTGGLLGYYAATPFIFMSILHFSASTYGYLSIATVVAYITGTNLSRSLSFRLGTDKTILLGIFVALFASLLMIINCLFFNLNAITVLIPMAVYALAGGLISPCSNAGAMAATRDNAGASGALMSTSYYTSWLIFSTILTHLSLNSLSTIATYISVIAVISLVGYWKLILSVNNK
jgi:DHA1 family bicyclomycin/chloramphenicol resistance-like MFS transporter